MQSTVQQATTATPTKPSLQREATTAVTRAHAPDALLSVE